MDQESLEILRMVQEGRVSPEQGAELLAALKDRPSGAAVGAGARPRFVRFRVDVKAEEGEKKVAVNMNLPVALADIVLRLAEGAKIQRGGETIQLGEYVKQLSGMDMGAILQMVKEGAEGKLVDVDVSGEEGEKVRVEVTVD